MLTASAKSASATPPLEAGTYPARCVGIVDLGEQMNDLAGRLQRQVMLMFEIPGERIEVSGEDRPRMMSATYTLSLSDKAKLRGVLESWRGKQFTEEELDGFDLRKIVNVPCMLSVVSKTSKAGKPYVAIGSVSKIPKGFAVPEAETILFVFDLDEDGCLDALETLPEWVRERVKQSETYKQMIESPTPKSLADYNSDELPFD